MRTHRNTTAKKSTRGKAVPSPMPTPASTKPTPVGRFYTEEEIAKLRDDAADEAVKRALDEECYSPNGRVEVVRRSIAKATKHILQMQNAIGILTIGKPATGADEWRNVAREHAIDALWQLHIEADHELDELYRLPWDGKVPE
jgi:hypothetical protein